ncbi:MAG: hypothetical protein GW808_10330 [Sphingomonadales bacterium]|nr:hypothetical protein [Sphingomonadales bacterium]PIX66324.1 MAG: hypothetical protein COZ43_07195 [Sphingomonadales bacterium CG_4_10_14_3_um_filter_58_15]NCP00746.1 hypothetical protein [Sphingomonadales bacterium]NCP26863.1 hypothetical protein [Sphingomonadales bacterium]NCP44724.1 hypothetical protein [Sphingomonadales bacterium]
MKNVSQTLIVGLFTATIVLTAPSVHAADSDKSETKSEKPERITDRRHPDYVRCRLEPIIGSLAKKRRVCMTNQQWAAHIQEGNRRANQFVSDMDGGMRMDVP